jgi:uncharacterized protein DUF3471
MHADPGLCWKEGFILASSPDRLAPFRRYLPAAPSLDQLNKQAKERLRELRATKPGAKLAEAQCAVAREYGFASWPALKVAVHPKLDRFTGHYRRDPNVMADTVFTITSNGRHLFVQGVANGRIRLDQTEPSIFVLPDTGQTYRFEGPPGQPATRVVVGEGFKSVEALRTDARAVEQAEAAFRRELAEQARPRTPIDIDPALFPGYVGTYVSPLGHVIEITSSGKRLFAALNEQASTAMEAEQPDHFFFPGIATQIRFLMRNGNAEAIEVHQFGRVMIDWRANSAAALEFVETVKRRTEQGQTRPRMMLSHERLKRFAGRYHLDQHAILTVTAEGDRLFGQMTDLGRFEMFAESEASFFAEAVQIAFVENEAGCVDRAVLHQAGIDLVLMRDMGAA